MLVGKALNGNIICSIGMKRTGDNYKEDEVYEICVLPLDLDLDPMFGKVFDKQIRVSEKHQDKVKHVLFSKSFSVVWDAFDLWFEETIKDGQILPLGYDWPLMSRFLESMFDTSGCKIYFSGSVRDIKSCAQYLNDLAEANDQKMPFSKLTLRYITNNCDASLPKDYSALDMAVKIATAYKRMATLDMSRSFLAF